MPELSTRMIYLENSKVALVYGQMNEPPGARLRVLPSLRSPWPSTSAMKKNQDVLALRRQRLPFLAGRFRGLRALLGRIPSAVGYQPTLAAEMGAMQERITSTTTKGSITSFQAVYVPADDLD